MRQTDADTSRMVSNARAYRYLLRNVMRICLRAFLTGRLRKDAVSSDESSKERSIQSGSIQSGFAAAIAEARIMAPAFTGAGLEWRG
ncbi:hypothetical protein [Caballeronia sp. KNU42]